MIRCWWPATVSLDVIAFVWRERWPTTCSWWWARCVSRRKYGDSVPWVLSSGAWMPTMKRPPSGVPASASAVIASSPAETPSQFGDPPTNVRSSSDSAPKNARSPSPIELTTPTSHELSSMAMRWLPSSTT